MPSRPKWRFPRRSGWSHGTAPRRRPRWIGDRFAILDHIQVSIFATTSIVFPAQPIISVAALASALAASSPSFLPLPVLDLGEHPLALFQQLRTCRIETRIATAVSNPVPVRVAVRSSLETRHSKERHQVR